VLSLLNRARAAEEANRHEEARDLADQGILLADRATISIGTRACLHEVAGRSRSDLWDLDALEHYQAALELYEKIPGAQCDIARVSTSLAAMLALQVTDLDRAEQLLLRSIDLQTKCAPSVSLFFEYAVLLEVLHQECRTGDAAPWIEKADAVVMASSPPDPNDAAIMCRIRANFAADVGNVTAAIEWEKKGLSELAKAAPHDTLSGRLAVTYERLATLEQARANYAESLEYFVKMSELPRTKSIHVDFDNESQLSLHFGYEAASSPKLTEHDKRHGLVSAHAGKALFPSELPPVEACRAEPAGLRRGLLNRYDGVSERFEHCLEHRTSKEGHSVGVTIRVEHGIVVAAEAVGAHAEPALLRCLVETAVGYEHPTDKLSEFERLSVD